MLIQIVQGGLSLLFSTTGKSAGMASGAFAVILMTVTVCQAEHRLEIHRSGTTGRVTSVTAGDGGAIPMAVKAGQGQVRAVDFFEEYGSLFGVFDTQKQLKTLTKRTDSIGQIHTSFQQMHDGVPVFTAVLKVHQALDGWIVAVNGHTHFVPEDLATIPSLDADEAAIIAVAQVDAEAPTVSSSRLVVVDPGWYGDPTMGPRLAYELVIAGDSSGVLETVFVDAQRGTVLDQWSLIHFDRERRVYDGQGAAELPGVPARSEGEPPLEPAGDAVIDDVNQAYDYMGDVYAFFRHAFARDSIDDLGLPLISTVNSTAVGDLCPTAFFTSELRQVVFCLGRTPDDVVAHEFTHGLTLFTAGLISQNQTGSLSEHFSFVFGETIDLYNSGSETAGQTLGPPPWSSHASGTGIDEPNNKRTRCSALPDYVDGVRWLYNEDRVQNEGAIFDFWDPTCFSDPDRAMSPLQLCATSNRGGTHQGAGIPNHAFALVTDGGSFNGRDVEGIGLMKSSAIWYRALTTYLTPGADFNDAFWALNRAASDLVGAVLNDPRTGEPSADMIDESDAFQLNQALLAVGLHLPGRCGQSTDVLDSTPAIGCANRELFLAEGFEQPLNADGGWSTSNTGPLTPYDWLVTDPEEYLPFDHPGRAAFCADLSSQCSAGDETAVHSLVSPVVALPADLSFPVLEFNHFLTSEPIFDGGVVGIRVNDGQWQSIPYSAFYYNPYNQLLFGAEQGNSNPLAGQPSFSGIGGRWGTSLVSLGSLVSPGDTIQVRFDFGKDSCGGRGGWYVDDVQIYDCLATSDCDLNGVPDNHQMAHNGRPDVVIRHESSHSESVVSDADSQPVNVEAERFDLLAAKTIVKVRIWGGYQPSSMSPSDHFTVVFHHRDPDSGLVGETISLQTPRRTAVQRSGFNINRVPEWSIALELSEPVVLPAGSYWVEVYANTSANAASFFWSSAKYIWPIMMPSASAGQAPGVNWTTSGPFHHAIELEANSIGDDCNRNDVLDTCDIDLGFSHDTNHNAVPDECEPPQPRSPSGRTR